MFLCDSSLSACRSLIYAHAHTCAAQVCGGQLAVAWTHPPLQLPFALLLHLQPVVQLLLQPLLGELDLPDGALVLQPPLASCQSHTLAVTLAATKAATLAVTLASDCRIWLFSLVERYKLVVSCGGQSRGVYILSLIKRRGWSVSTGYYCKRRRKSQRKETVIKQLENDRKKEGANSFKLSVNADGSRTDATKGVCVCVCVRACVSHRRRPPPSLRSARRP